MIMDFHYKPPKVSFSQLMTFVRCPEHYLFRYVLGIKTPPRKSLIRGRAFHEALAFYFQEKKEGRVMPLKDLQEFYQLALGMALEDYQGQIEESQALLTKEYLNKEKETKAEELLISGANGLAAYKEKVAKKISPKFIEQDFELPLDKNLALMGKIDLIDKKGVIYETKTAGRRPSRQQINLDLQLALYQLGFKEIQGRKPKGFSKDFVVFTKKGAEIIRFPLKEPLFKEKDIRHFVSKIILAIENNIWYCLHPTDSWICSKEWCGYWKLHKELRERGLNYMIEKYKF